MKEINFFRRQVTDRGKIVAIFFANHASPFAGARLD
jgi:hypothetical protein